MYEIVHATCTQQAPGEVRGQRCSGMHHTRANTRTVSLSYGNDATNLATCAGACVSFSSVSYQGSASMRQPGLTNTSSLDPQPAAEPRLHPHPRTTPFTMNWKTSLRERAWGEGAREERTCAHAHTHTCTILPRSA